MAVRAGDLARHRFTVEEFRERFGEDDRVELIDGDIIDMAPIGRKHNTVTSQLSAVFAHLLLEERAWVQSQGPVTISDLASEPQPDLLVARWREDRYWGGVPSAADALLVVEVSDSTVEGDRRVKVPLYLQAGVPEVWIVDVAGGLLEVHRVGSRPVLCHGDAVVSPGAFPDVVVEVGWLFGEDG